MFPLAPRAGSVHAFERDWWKRRSRRRRRVSRDQDRVGSFNQFRRWRFFDRHGSRRFRLTHSMRTRASPATPGSRGPRASTRRLSMPKPPLSAQARSVMPIPPPARSACRPRPMLPRRRRFRNPASLISAGRPDDLEFAMSTDCVAERDGFEGSGHRLPIAMIFQLRRRSRGSVTLSKVGRWR